MKAIQFTAYGGPEVVQYADVPRPAVSSRDVLIRVVASSINPVDRKTREGDRRAMQALQMPFVPGWDAAGIVEFAGAEATEFTPGQAVYALPGARGGGWAEFCAVPAKSVAPKPATLSFAEAGSLPLVALTAWQGLFVHGGLQPGQRVLISGAAGGVGSQAVQLAHAKGAHVTAVARTGTVEQVESLGADKVLDDENFLFESHARDMDVVLDLLGGGMQDKLWETLKPGGILVCTVGPPPPEQAAAAGVRAIGFGVRPDSGQLREIGALADAGKLRALVDREMPLAEAGQGLEELTSGRSRGKLVLRVTEG